MIRNRIATCLWFDHGQVREAAEFYVTTFPDSHLDARRSAPTDGPDSKRGAEISVEFTVLGMPFVAVNGGPHFRFSEAISFQVYTDGQGETDRYWTAIVGNGGTESRCGWCKDKFGVSWQILPRALLAAISDPDAAAAKRAMDAMMGMARIDIAGIDRARTGKPLVRRTPRSLLGAGPSLNSPCSSMAQPPSSKPARSSSISPRSTPAP